MKKITVLILAFIVSAVEAFSQNPTQTVRGTVLDKLSQTQLPGATVLLVGTDPVKASVCDAEGRFKITGVEVGRYDLKITYIGYKEIVLPNIQVTAGKEVVMDIGMEENVSELGEII